MNAAENSVKPTAPQADCSDSASFSSGQNNADGIAAENSVLDEIVRASGLDPLKALDQQLLRAEFLNVARTFKDVEFSVSPVVTALVHVALGKLSGIDAEAATQLEQFVATSMCDNTETHVRVRRFWDSLIKIVNESEQ